MLLNIVPLRTRRVLLLYKLYGIRALLFLMVSSLDSINALLVGSQLYELPLTSKLHVFLLMCNNSDYSDFMSF